LGTLKVKIIKANSLNELENGINDLIRYKDEMDVRDVSINHVEDSDDALLFYAVIQLIEAYHE
jgi:hypothetical protein